MIALAIFGGHGNGNAVHLRWLDEEAGRVSAQYDNAEAAWWHRRCIPSSDLLVEDIDLAGVHWAWYASVLHAPPDDVPTSYSRYSLDRYVRQDQVVAAIREYTRLRTQDKESLAERAHRLLGRAACRAAGIETHAQISRGFGTLERKRHPIRSNGRDWVRVASCAPHVELLQASSGKQFAVRMLRRNHCGIDL